jgi:hypothetical protein
VIGADLDKCEYPQLGSECGTGRLDSSFHTDSEESQQILALARGGTYFLSRQEDVEGASISKLAFCTLKLLDVAVNPNIKRLLRNLADENERHTTFLPLKTFSAMVSIVQKTPTRQAHGRVVWAVKEGESLPPLSPAVSPLRCAARPSCFAA